MKNLEFLTILTCSVVKVQLDTKFYKKCNIIFNKKNVDEEKKTIVMIVFLCQI